MAYGRGARRIGYLLAPPYVPIVVAEANRPVDAAGQQDA
jgi:hypothetical protein